MRVDQVPVASFIRRRRLLVAVLLALALIAAGEGYRAWNVVQAVVEGRELLRTGQEMLESTGLDATERELQAIAADFRSAEEQFASASSTLKTDPLAWGARRVPFVGGQIDTAIVLADAGEAASGIGLAGVNAAEEFVSIRREGEGTLPEKSEALFEATGPHIAAIEAQLSAVNELRTQIGDRPLLPPLRAAVDELDDRRAQVAELVATYNRGRAFAPEFLGFSEPRTYLILAHNNAELLPTGGLVSVVGTMRIDRGRIEDIELEDAVEFSRSWRERTGAYVEPPAPLQQYLLKDYSWNLPVSNWSPDFPTAAQQAEYFFELGGGSAVDGVIGINLNTMERLLAVVGPVEVAEFGVTVTSENAFEVTEERTRAPFEPQGDRKEFVVLLAQEVLDRVLRPAPGSWSPLVAAIQELGEEKDLLLYSRDPQQQELIRQFGWDGEVNYSSGDFLMLVDASLNGTKLNAVLEESVDIEIRLSEDGSARTTVTIDYVNDLAPWEDGRDPALVRKLMLGGLYGGYLRLFVPPGSRIIEVRDDSHEIGLEEIGEELGLTVFGRFFALPRDSRQRLVYEYVVPAAVGTQRDPGKYLLTLQKQPGQKPLPVTLRILPPEGMEISSAVAAGETVPFSPAIELVLDRDWTLELKLSRRS